MAPCEKGILALQVQGVVFHAGSAGGLVVSATAHVGTGPDSVPNEMADCPGPRIWAIAQGTDEKWRFP